MTLYLGRPGALVALPDPDPGVSVAPVRAAADHQLLGGGRVVDLLGTPRRVITASWTRLLDDEYALLEEFHSGARGTGPFTLLPSAASWNYLTSVQASATSVTADTSGWTVTAPETIASALSPVVRGPRCLAWSVPAAPASGLLAPLPPGGAAGWATPPAVPWHFAAVVRASGALELSARLRWLDASGAQVDLTIGGTTAVTSTGWAYPSVSATAPAGAAFVVPRLFLHSSTVTAPSTVYVDVPQLGIGFSPGNWTPGRGLPLVALTDLTDTYPWADVHDAKATFTEVG